MCSVSTGSFVTRLFIERKRGGGIGSMEKIKVKKYD